MRAINTNNMLGRLNERNKAFLRITCIALYIWILDSSLWMSEIY